jgi:ATP-dependent Clp protease ATP-binding subunit ClpA
MREVRVFEVFSSPSMEMLRIATIDAKEKRFAAVDIGHLTLGLIASDGVASQALRTLDAVDRFQLLAEVASRPEVLAKGDPMTYSPHAKKLFEQARAISEETHANMVDTGHVLAAIVQHHRNVLGLTGDDVASDALLDAVNRARAVAPERSQ